MKEKRKFEYKGIEQQEQRIAWIFLPEDANQSVSFWAGSRKPGRKLVFYLRKTKIIPVHTGHNYLPRSNLFPGTGHKLIPFVKVFKGGVAG